MKRLKFTVFAIILLMLTSAKLSAQIITTIAGASIFIGPGSGGFSGDSGSATAALLNSPCSIAFDTLGNIYIADEQNVHIRKVDSSGVITSIAGTDFYGYGGDDSIATAAKFCDLGFIKMDRNGMLYIPDICNNRIRKINLSTNVITTAIGNGASFCSGGDGLATSTSIRDPFSVEIDRLGNVYFSTVCNYIYRVDSGQHLTVIAGSDSLGGYAGDQGQATNALLNHPLDLAVDLYGNIYFTEAWNNIIRKIDSFGIITTFAGDSTWGYYGDGGPAIYAQFRYPTGIAVDGEGNVFFADCGNNVIRRIDRYTNIITTVVGCGFGAAIDSGGFFGDNGPATAAALFHPDGITFDKDGNLYIADWLNNRVRKVTNVGVPLGERSVGKQSDDIISVYPNPARNEVNIKTGAAGLVQILDLTGRCMTQTIVHQTPATLNIEELPPGIYVVVFTDTNGNKRYGKFARE